jgi:diamine N-acetyltransferase
MSKLGNKIKEIRTSNNLTLQEFADSLGYTSKSTITKIEKGNNDITFSQMIKLSQIYSVDLNELADNKIINVDLLKYSLPNLEFREINKDNFYNVCKLDVKEEDKEFVASNEMSLAEAYLFKTMGAYVLPIAIYRNRVPIGFAMITKGNIGDNIKGEYINNYCILRMMIEAKHQNKGLGKLALKQLIEIIKSISVSESFIWISTEERNAKAIHVYEDNGFKKTSDHCGEEIILKYDLNK